jgi:hypothetical protein
MSVEWIEHKGKRILYMDHRGCQPEQMIENLELGLKMVQETPPQTKILLLVDIEGSVNDTAVMARLKEVGKEVEPKTEKEAIVGVHGVRHIMLSAYNRVTGAGKTQRLFDSQDEALDWLVSDK